MRTTSDGPDYQALNASARYLPPSPDEPESVLVIALGPDIRATAYFDPEGTLVLAIDTDGAESALRTGPGGRVPVEVRVDGLLVLPARGPVPGELEPDRVAYLAPTGPAERPLRAFRTGPRHVTCFVTEVGAGMSVTNASVEVRAALQALWPEEAIRLIEHYPATEGEPAHYDEAFTAPGGSPQWRRLAGPALAVEFDRRLP